MSKKVTQPESIGSTPSISKKASLQSNPIRKPCNDNNFAARSVAAAFDHVRGMTVDEAAAAGSTVRNERNHATRQVTVPPMEPTIVMEVCHD